MNVPVTQSQVTVRSPRRRTRGEGPPFQGFIEFQGIPIDVENLAGTMRSGTAENGTKWESLMVAHYGEIPWRDGVDGDKVDVFVGSNADSPLVVVIHAADIHGAYDEDKIMLGFDSATEAIRAFKACYDKPRFYGGHTTTNIGHLRRWLEAGGPPSRFHKGGRSDIVIREPVRRLATFWR